RHGQRPEIQRCAQAHDRDRRAVRGPASRLGARQVEPGAGADRGVAMTARDSHVAGQRPDWFPPPRVTTPDYPAASIEAWRTSPAVRKERRRGIAIGFALGMVVYGIGSLMLVL